MISLFRPASVVIALGFAAPALLLACDKEEQKPKAQADKPKDPEKIPEGFVVNDFFNDKGAPVRAMVDGAAPEGMLAGGGPAGSGAPAGGSASHESASPPAEAASGVLAEVKLLEPGAEPRAARRYAFGTQAETRSVKTETAATVEAQGQKQNMNQPGLKSLVALAVKPGSGKDTFVVSSTLKKVEILGLNPADAKQQAEAAKALAPLQGLALSFDTTSRGGAGEPRLAAAKAPQPGAEEMVGLVAQIAELLAIPLPEEAIGVGAKWQRVSSNPTAGMKAVVTTTYTLTSWAGDSGVIDAKIVQRAERQAANDPRLPKGSTVELSGNGAYTFEVSTGSLTNKAKGEVTSVVKIAVARGPQTQNLTQTVKLSQEVTK